MKLRFLATVAVLATSVLATAPASANIPVIDPTAIARIREQVSVATKQLGAIQQQVSQVTQMRNTIGQIGPGSLGNILSQSGLSFSGPQNVLSQVTSLSSQAKTSYSQMTNLKMPGEGSLSLGSITTLDQGRDAAKKLFFYNGDGDMNANTVNALRARRNIVVRDSAVNAYGAAAAMKADMTQSTQMADKLAAQAQAAPDLRGDVQANTAAMLAVYSEVAKQTALQSQMLELASAQQLATDSTGKAQ